MSKRVKFIISSVILSLGFVAVQFIDTLPKIPLIFGLVFFTGLMAAWSFKETLGKNMTWISIILPMLFTLGVGLFWFLLPVSIFTRIPVIMFYFVGIYIMLTTMNIYTVSSFKTIALLRAARGVGFVMTLVITFLIYDAILSLRQNIFISSGLVFVSSFLLFLQGFWSIDLEERFDKKLFVMTLISALIMLEINAMLFFWPATVVVGSLFLTSGVYLLLGLGQAKLEERLFPSVIREYLTVGIVVLIGMFFATSWGGK